MTSQVTLTLARPQGELQVDLSKNRLIALLTKALERERLVVRVIEVTKGKKE